MHTNAIRIEAEDFEADLKQSFPGRGPMRPVEAENERLRRKVQKFKAARDVMKKQVSIYNAKMRSFDEHMAVAGDFRSRRCRKA